jgi:beta-lactam-binding protein with PASTA domain/predicted Ser/Thr protein kinase
MRLAEDSVVDGRYRVLRRLGSGGMADVWCAQDQQLDRKVALKVLHHRFAQDHEFVERFRREASAAAGLQHPNVVGIFDRGEVDGTYYIAMQYVEGASLKQLIERGLSISAAVGVIRQVLEATRFAHEHGIVHRDLKPHNILVNREGRATVADFGIARAGHSEITQTGSVMGTAHYLSPEQAQGLPVTPASDLYSIGVMLYEALTRQVPFEGDSAVAVALKQVSEQPEPPSRLNPEVSPALDSVVLKALAKDPSNRFSSADEFLRALEAAKREPGQPIGETQAFAAVVPAPVGAEDEAAVAEDAPPIPPPPDADADARRRRWRWIALVVIGLLLGGVAAWALTRPAQVLVPDVARPGTDVEEATTILEAEGFEVVQEGRPAEQREGQVIETDPPAGDEVDEGSTVTVFFSEGLGQARVPNVVGLTREEAERLLDEEGFGATFVERPDSDVDEGLVISTRPPANTRLDVGDTVRLFVSSGPDLTTVPDVVGESEATAEAEIEQAGFVPNVDTAESDVEEGTVFDQTPDGGQEAETGSEVTIVVSEGPAEPETVTVPNVEGLRQDRATSALSGDGFDVSIDQVETSDSTEDGIVLDQFPSGGTEAEPGTQVTIRVGTFVKPEPENEGQPVPE